MKGLDLRRKSLQRSFVCDPELTERKKFISSLSLSHSLSFSVSTTANEAAILSNMKTPGDTGKFSHTTTTTTDRFNLTLDCCIRKSKRLKRILVSFELFVVLGEFLSAYASR